MSVREREAFLADVHVGVISIAREGRAPLAVPVWYDYEPGGELWLVTERDSRKGKALVAAGAFSLCAQSEAPPYRYVSVEGPLLAIEPADDEKHRRPMAHRYLGRDLGNHYMETTADSGVENVVVRMRPERWLTLDYAKQFSADVFKR